MDERTTEPLPPCLKEAFRGNVRARLHELRRFDNSPTYMVEVAARNSWAQQGKLIGAIGGIDLDTAEGLFERFTERVRGYDWHEDEFVLEGD